MLVCMGLDDTYTDLEFKQRIAEANLDWMRQFPQTEPDLKVEGFKYSLLGALLSLFSPKS
jgi:hypothetical protein